MTRQFFLVSSHFMPVSCPLPAWISSVLSSRVNCTPSEVGMPEKPSTPSSDLIFTSTPVSVLVSVSDVPSGPFHWPSQASDGVAGSGLVGVDDACDGEEVSCAGPGGAWLLHPAIINP